MLKSFRFPVVIVGLMAVLMFAAAPSLEAAPPVNDACSAATSAATMPPAFNDYIPDTMEATGEASPTASCNLDPTFKNQHSVWYVWTAPTAAPVEINTFGSNYDTVVAIWSGACGTLAEVACNDDNGVVAHGVYQSLVTFTPVAGTTYYFEVMGYDDLEFGSLVVNVQAPGASAMCEQSSDPQLIASSTNEQSESSINAAGEAVWVEYNPANNYDQIMSSKRGALVTDAAFHYSPSINGLGDVVWSQVVTGFEQVQKRSNAGAVTTLTTGNVHHSDPAINDSGEVVWVQFDSASGYDQIYSSTRGLLTSSAAWHYSPAINNSGEVCWSQYDPATLETQIACLGGGMITTGVNEHYSPSINNAGIIVWSEVDAATGDASIVASDVSVPVPSACPIGKHLDPAINNCGDIVFTNKFASGSQQVYVLGSGASCLADVTGVNPALLTSGAVTLSGVRFAGATVVKLSDGTALTGVSVVSDAVINAVVPTGIAPGNYDVMVSTPNGTNSVSTAKLGIGSLCDVTGTNAPTSMSMTFSPVSPQPVGGDVILGLTPNATGCGGFLCQYSLDGATLNYQNHNIVDWPDLYPVALNALNQVTWKTRGMQSGATYRVRCYFKNKAGNQGLVKAESTYTFTNDPEQCDPNTAPAIQCSFNPSSPGTQGEKVAINCSQTLNQCGVLYKMQYRKKGDAIWIPFEKYTQQAIQSLDTTGLLGTYEMRAIAYNDRSTGPVYSIWGPYDYDIVSNPVCTVGLSPSPGSPQQVNSGSSFADVTLTATPSSACGVNPNLTYSISTSGANSWSPIANCPTGPSTTCLWAANAAGQGTWDLKVDIQGQAASATVSGYALDVLPPAVSLSPSKASPQTPPYQDVLLTATPLHFNNPEYLFTYRLQGDVNYTSMCGSLGTNLTDPSDDIYVSLNTCNWLASTLAQGIYDVKVESKNVGSLVAEAVTSMTYSLNAASTCDATGASPPTSISWNSILPASPQAVDATVALNVDVVATGCYATLWQYANAADLIYQNHNISDWAQATNTMNWDTRGMPAGTYNIRVYAKNIAGNQNVVKAETTYTLTGTSSCNPTTNPVLSYTLTPSSPVPAGTDILIDFSSTTNQCNALFKPQYRLKGAVDWVSGGKYSQQRIQHWSTTGLAPGLYEFRGIVYNDKGSGAYSLLITEIQIQ